MKQYRTSLFLAFAFVAAAIGCSTTQNKSAPPDETEEPDPSDDGGTDEEDAGPPPEPSCDPYEPRATTPELLIGPKGLEEKLTKLIDGAKKSLDIEMYELDTDSIIEALVDAQGRGVKVRIVLDRNHTAPKAKLTEGGVEVKDSSEEFPNFHAKTMIIDGKSAVVMSANMNSYSMESERNYGIIDVERDDIEGLQQIFDHDWEGGGFAGLSLPCTRLVVSPINSRDLLTEFMNKAEKTLDLSVMYVTDKDFVATIEEKAAAGTAVRVLLADPAWIDGNDATATELASKKIPVKFLKKYELHAKLLLSESAAFVGSENFSRPSVDSNREVGVFVTNEEPLAEIRKQFEADWEIGVDP